MTQQKSEHAATLLSSVKEKIRKAILSQDSKLQEYVFPSSNVNLSSRINTQIFKIHGVGEKLEGVDAAKTNLFSALVTEGVFDNLDAQDIYNLENIKAVNPEVYYFILQRSTGKGPRIKSADLMEHFFNESIACIAQAMEELEQDYKSIMSGDFGIEKYADEAWACIMRANEMSKDKSTWAQNKMAGVNEGANEGESAWNQDDSRKKRKSRNVR